MEWEEFYNLFLSKEDTFEADNFIFLKSYGSSDEVLKVAAAFEDESHRLAFLTSAHRFGTVYQPSDFQLLSKYLKDRKLCDYILSSSKRKYTKDELKLVEEYVSKEAIQYVANQNGFEYFEDNPFIKHIPPQKDIPYQEEPKLHAGSILKGLFAGVAIFGGIFLGAIFHSASEKSKPRVCNGDCTNCPPHFGYRYGRWYYGHDHVGRCEFGGNRGSGRID